jgi:hypothetical protein
MKGKNMGEFKKRGETYPEYPKKNLLLKLIHY